MSQKIKLKRSNLSGNIPSADQLDIGEIALNMADSKLFFKDPSNNVKQVISPSSIQNLSDTFISSLQIGQILKYDGSNWINHTLSKNDVGLNNVDNTSDLDKPISTATQAALDNKIEGSTGNKGDMYYHDGTKWVKLAAGTVGQILSVGSDGTPEWQDLTVR